MLEKKLFQPWSKIKKLYLGYNSERIGKKYKVFNFFLLKERKL